MSKKNKLRSVSNPTTETKSPPIDHPEIGTILLRLTVLSLSSILFSFSLLSEMLGVGLIIEARLAVIAVDFALSPFPVTIRLALAGVVTVRVPFTDDLTPPFFKEAGGGDSDERSAAVALADAVPSARFLAAKDPAAEEEVEVPLIVLTRLLLPSAETFSE